MPIESVIFMTQTNQPQNNLAALDKKVSDANQADNQTQTQPGQQKSGQQSQSPPGQINQPGQNDKTDDKKSSQPDADKSMPGQQGSKS